MCWSNNYANRFRSGYGYGYAYGGYNTGVYNNGGFYNTAMYANSGMPYMTPTAQYNRANNFNMPYGGPYRRYYY